MEDRSDSRLSEVFESFGGFLRRCFLRILSVGPIPNHFAFIMDGNRRYAQKENLEVGAGHRAGFSSLMSILNYCYELGVKYVTIYAFSIENFKRKHEEVQNLMDLLLEKIEELLKKEIIVNRYGIRVCFIGNLKLLNEPVRLAAEKMMKVTATNRKCVLLICIAYTSCDEIVNAVKGSCKDKLEEIRHSSACEGYKGESGEVDDAKRMDSTTMNYIQEHCKNRAYECRVSRSSIASYASTTGSERTVNKNAAVDSALLGSSEIEWDESQALKFSNGNGVLPVEENGNLQGECSTIKQVDIEKHMYMAVAPDPDIIIRSSGETRLSNFLLWQTSNCLLYSPKALWPEIGLRHLVWGVLQFQRNHSYLEKRKKQL